MLTGRLVREPGEADLVGHVAVHHVELDLGRCLLRLEVETGVRIHVDGELGGVGVIGLVVLPARSRRAAGAYLLARALQDES